MRIKTGCIPQSIIQLNIILDFQNLMKTISCLCQHQVIFLESAISSSHLYPIHMNHCQVSRKFACCTKHEKIIYLFVQCQSNTCIALQRHLSSLKPWVPYILKLVRQRDYNDLHLLSQSSFRLAQHLCKCFNQHSRWSQIMAWQTSVELSDNICYSLEAIPVAPSSNLKKTFYIKSKVLIALTTGAKHCKVCCTTADSVPW